MSRRMTQEEFLQKSRKRHGNTYSYNTTGLMSAADRVIITCELHGDFSQKAAVHCAGHGCPSCGKERWQSINQRKRDAAAAAFIARAAKVHGGKYNYSKVVYTRSQDKVLIVCPVHGDFFQIANDHLGGSGCVSCKVDAVADWHRKSEEEFLAQAMAVHGDRYDYSRTKYIRSQSPVEIICRQHGQFMQMPCVHLLGCGCPRCKESRGEAAIAKALSAFGVDFEREKRMPGCVDSYPLRFDFWVPSANLLIEYDGRQHVKGWMDSPDALADTLRKDAIKSIYAREAGIRLLRIPHTMRHRIAPWVAMTLRDCGVSVDMARLGSFARASF